MSSEGNNCEQQSTLFSCSSHSCLRMPVSEKPGNIKLSSSEPDCSITAITKRPKLCKPCTINLTTPKPFTLYAQPCECEDKTLLSLTASEEDTHEDEPCDIPGCIHISQGDETSYEDSDPCPVSCTGACSSQSPVISPKPTIYIDPFLKDYTPESIEDLKASITGLTNSKNSLVGNVVECENIEYCYEVRSSKSDCGSKNSKSDGLVKVPIRQGISLIKEPNDHRFCTNPDTCIHSRKSGVSPPCPPEVPPCLPEAPPCTPVEPPCPAEAPPCFAKAPPCPPKAPPCAPKAPPFPPKAPPCAPKAPPCPPKTPPCPPKTQPCLLEAPPPPPKAQPCSPKAQPCFPKAPPPPPKTQPCSPKAQPCFPKAPPPPPKTQPCSPTAPPCSQKAPQCSPEAPPCPPEKPPFPPEKPGSRPGTCLQLARKPPCSS